MSPEFEPFGSAIEEEEWKAQEAALSDPSMADSALALDYKRLAQALRGMPCYELPDEFARRTADTAQRQAYSLDVFERRALTALSLIFLTTLVVIETTTIASTPASSLRSDLWLYVLVACALVVNLMLPISSLKKVGNIPVS